MGGGVDFFDCANVDSGSRAEEILRNLITYPIFGARNLEQLEGQLKSVEIEMTPELYPAISALSPGPPPATDRIDIRK